MSQRFTPASSNTPTLFLIVSLVLAGAMSTGATAEELLSRSPERGGIGLELQRLQQVPSFSKQGMLIREGLLNKLDERLSLIVTDKASTSAITFSEVMQKLADEMDVDKLSLFRRWWGTAKKTDDNIFCHSRSQTINGFPYQCPREEGRQADLNPFDCADACDGYTAIAFVNRFDLADKDRGQHCGEFRIVFARNSGLGTEQNCQTNLGERNLIIFEALVPNPRPPHSPVEPIPDNIFANLAGCRPIVEFWLSLSNPNMSTADRGRALHNFFLKGLPYDGIGPVVDARNYAGGPASGQIRTNQFMRPHWTLREFKTYDSSIIPANVKSNPGNSLFGEDLRKTELADYLARRDALDFLRGVNIPKGDENENSIFTFAFGLTTPGIDHLNSFESDAEFPPAGDAFTAFDDCRKNSSCSHAIEKSLTDKLGEVKSQLTTDNIIHRIRAQTCAGCHHYSAGDTELKVICPGGWPETFCFDRDGKHLGIWPNTLGGGPGQIPDASGAPGRSPGFTHVSEIETETGEDKEVFDFANLGKITPERLGSIRPRRTSHLNYMGPDGGKSRYRISDTLKLVLMPPRFENMVLYLNQFPPP
jgi:hypothetical protein